MSYGTQPLPSHFLFPVIAMLSNIYITTYSYEMFFLFLSAFENAIVIWLAYCAEISMLSIVILCYSMKK